MSAAENYHNLSNEELQQRLSERDQAIAQRDRPIKALEETIRLHKLRRFGACSEKSQDQQALFNEAELSVVAEEGLIEQEAQARGAKKKRTRSAGRRPLPAKLTRVRIEHDVSESEKHCCCGAEHELIGEELSEQLDIVPAQIQVLVNARKKYACKHCESGVITAALPAQPIPKSNASPGLLAHIATAKYQDALPLYRQEAILARHGIDIGRNTLAGWMIKAGELIQPLLNLPQEKMLAYPILHCDETPVQVLNEQGKRAQSTSYMWVRVGGPPTQPIRLFHYADSRSGEVARHLLEDYEGYVQSDDYAGYNRACENPGITQLVCWAHARRKFVEAQKVAAGATGKADMASANLYGLIETAKANGLEPYEYLNKVFKEVPLAQSLEAIEALLPWNQAAKDS